MKMKSKKHQKQQKHLIYPQSTTRRLKNKQCRKLDLLKLCNYILISCLVLVSLANGTDTILGGCSSNPCVFGVCIDEING